MSDYPTLMFRCPGAHFAHNGQTYDWISVESKEQLIDRLEAGWSVTLLEAVAIANEHEREEELPVVAPESADRHELEVLAKELGVKFDGRTSDSLLLQRIKDAQAGE
ncbi:hypothetical protein D3C81_1855660 [compost metagenome]